MATRGRKAKAPTLSAWVNDWVDAYCDAGGDRNAPAIADMLINEVPMMLVVSDARALMLRYAGAALRRRYTASVPNGDGTVRYEQPRLMGWDEMILSVHAMLKLGNAQYAKAARIAEEWLTENPGSDFSVSDIIEQAQAVADAPIPDGFVSRD